MRAAVARRGVLCGAAVAGPGLVLLGITFYITLGQVFRGYPPRFDWPTFFSIARLPAWFAVLMLAADAVLARDWRAAPGSGDANG